MTVVIPYPRPDSFSVFGAFRACTPEEERDALREEIARLNQEIQRQQMELDILKKAARYFAMEPD